MRREHRRPLVAFLLVTLVCTVMIAHGLRANALDLWRELSGSDGGRTSASAPPAQGSGSALGATRTEPVTPAPSAHPTTAGAATSRPIATPTPVAAAVPGHSPATAATAASTGGPVHGLVRAVEPVTTTVDGLVGGRAELGETVAHAAGDRPIAPHHASPGVTGLVTP